MKRHQYVRTAIDLYLEAPGTPARATRRDRAVAGDLYRRDVPIDRLAHAIRLASIRRLTAGPATIPPSVHSLAYYRAVVDRLQPDECTDDYVNYVRDKFAAILPRIRSHREPEGSAVSQPDSRAL